MSIIELNPNDENAWDDYVSHHPQGSIYHLSTWRHLIKNQFGHTGYYYLAKQDNAIQGVLPVIRLKSRLFGDYYVSVPYFNYGGALANSDAVTQQLMQHVSTVAKQQGGSHIEFRDTCELTGDWGVRTDKVTMILDLPATTDELWKAIGSKLRAQIRRPQREQVSVQHGHLDLLDDYYRVFAHNMRDLGTPVYSKRFFKTILQTFSDNAHIICVYHQGQPAAAGFLLGYKHRLEIPWASSLREFNRISVNMLLYWEVLSYAIEQGYQQFDFGRSSIDAGTYRFKKQWGAKPMQLYWHYWLCEGGEVPQLNPNNPKYKMAIKLWQKLPVWLANRLGPPIVKNLP